MNKIGILLSLLTFFLQLQETFGQPTKLGTVVDASLSEISGITSSEYAKKSFWVHNDSGDGAKIYLIDSIAKLQTTLHLEGISVTDCEDIARVIIDNQSYLILADIGNNLRNRTVLQLYMFPEPKIGIGVKEVTIPLHSIKKLSFSYKDKKRDAEAVFVDPIEQEVYIVSKRDFRSTVFSFPLTAFDHIDTLSLEPKLELPFNFTTAADMRMDGRFILIKNLTHVYLWERQPNESVLKALSRPYTPVPYIVEPQGESICFDKDGRYFYTISERPLGLDSYLYQYLY